MAKPITITVAGQKYTVKGADEEHLRRLAAFVDERIEDARRVAKAASPQHLLVLAALNMADELFALEARRRALVEETRTRVKRVLGRLG